MGYLQELNEQQISQALLGAAERHVPVTIILRRGDLWSNLRSRFLGIRGTRLVFTEPLDANEEIVNDFAPAEKVGVSFKYKHHKHMFSSTVIGNERMADENGNMINVICLACPTHVERIQRRAYYRAVVPENCIVRVSFWMGGRDCEPMGTSPDRPVWSGRVTDLSAGGFQVLTSSDVAMALDVGDTVGLRMTFGPARESIYGDAQFRHPDIRPDGALLGFQFLGLGQSPDGKAALRLISSKVSEYQRLELHSRTHV